MIIMVMLIIPFHHKDIPNPLRKLCMPMLSPLRIGPDVMDQQLAGQTEGCAGAGAVTFAAGVDKRKRGGVKNKQLFQPPLDAMHSNRGWIVIIHSGWFAFILIVNFRAVCRTYLKCVVSRYIVF
jgi:hypothetical protein